MKTKVKILKLTLIEVVVVLFTSVLLAVLLAFFLHSARESRCKIACVGNLKQIGMSLRMYSNVYAEEFPNKNGRTGLQMLLNTGFLENTPCYRCPSTKDRIADSSKISTNASYCYAGGLNEARSVDSALVADRAYNHWKYGQILFVDGHAKGYSGANWSSNRGETILTDF